MSVAIQKDSTTNVLEKVALAPTDAAALSDLGTAASGKTNVVFPTATWNALTEKPDANGGWTVSDAFAVALVDKSELDKLKDDARELLSWIDQQGNDIAKFAHHYPDGARIALANGESEAIRGAHIILLRTCSTTGLPGLTIAKRRDWCAKMMEGFADAANIQAAYPRVVIAGVARALQGLTPTVRTPNSPLSWVDPRTDPMEKVAVADVIDFSGSAGYTKSDNTVVTGLGLQTTHADLAADYVANDWIDDILGDVPGYMFDLACTAPQIPAGDTTVSGSLSWTLPEDSGSALTGIELGYRGVDVSDYGGSPISLPANTVATSISNLGEGLHHFRTRGVNANGNGPWTEIGYTVTAAPPAE